MGNTEITSVQLSKQLLNQIKEEQIKFGNVNLITLEQKIAYFYDTWKQSKK